MTVEVCSIDGVNHTGNGHGMDHRILLCDVVSCSVGERQNHDVCWVDAAVNHVLNTGKNDCRLACSGTCLNQSQRFAGSDGLQLFLRETRVKLNRCIWYRNAG